MSECPKNDLSDIPKLNNLRLNSIEFIMHSHRKGGYRKKNRLILHAGGSSNLWDKRPHMHKKPK